MSAKAVREHRGKKLLARHVKELSEGKHVVDDRSVLVTPETDLEKLPESESWLKDQMLVVKPDQLIKRRGKAGLVGIKLTYEEVKEWIRQRMNTDITVDGVKGRLHTFIIDPFVAHSQVDEYYICIQSDRNGEDVLFYSEGGVDVGDVDSKARRLHVGIDESLTVEAIASNSLLEGVPEARLESLSSFVVTLFQVYRKLNFTYMEINPIVFDQKGTIAPLDLAAKIDETAAFLNASDWGPGPLDLPPAFGRQEFPEEAYIRELDSKTGASLKLTVLNPTGKIWTMVRACVFVCGVELRMILSKSVILYKFVTQLLVRQLIPRIFLSLLICFLGLYRLPGAAPRWSTPIPFPTWDFPTNLPITENTLVLPVPSIRSNTQRR